MRDREIEIMVEQWQPADLAMMGSKGGGDSREMGARKSSQAREEIG